MGGWRSEDARSSRWVRGTRWRPKLVFVTCLPNILTKHVYKTCFHIMLHVRNKVASNICFHDALLPTALGHLVTQAFLQMTFLLWILTEWAPPGHAQNLLSSQDITISLRNEHDGLSRIGILRGCQFLWELWGLHEITRFSRGERLGPSKNCLSEVEEGGKKVELNWISVNKKCCTLLNVLLVGGARGLSTRQKPKTKPNQITANIRSRAHYSMVGGASTAEELQSKFIPSTWMEVQLNKRGKFIIIDGSEWDILAFITQYGGQLAITMQRNLREKGVIEPLLLLRQIIWCHWIQEGDCDV